jgi:uncharacterized caspase-like protein
VNRALLIGINAYPGDAALRKCVSDAMAARTFLLLRAGFKVPDVWLLTDADATTEAVNRALDWLLHNLVEGDRWFLLWSGHGAVMTHEDGATEECLCPVDFDWSAMRAILATSLRERFARIPGGVAGTAVLDSCYSGGMLSPRRKAPAGSPVLGYRKAKTYPLDASLNRGNILPDLAMKTVAQPHAAVISGCRADQVSEETSAGGVCTNALLAALAGADGLQVSHRTLVNRMQFYADCNGFNQVPQLLGYEELLNRPLADLSAGMSIREDA